MKLGKFPRAAIGRAVALSVVAAAQSGSQGGLNIPNNVQFVGPQDPAVRKATAIVNGEVITESDIDHRLALLLGPNRPSLAEELPRARAQVLRGLIDETLQIQAAAQQEITVEDREVEQYYSGLARDNNQTPRPSPRICARWARRAFAEAPDPRQPRLAAPARPLDRPVRQRRRGRGPGDDRAPHLLARNLRNIASARSSSRPRRDLGRGARQRPAHRRAGPRRRAVPGLRPAILRASTAALGGDLGWVRWQALPPELAVWSPGCRSARSACRSRCRAASRSSTWSIPARSSALTRATPCWPLFQLSVELPAPPAQAQARAQQLAAATQSMLGGCGRAAEWRRRRAPS